MEIRLARRLYREIGEPEKKRIVELIGDALHRSSYDDQLSIIASLSLWLAEASINPISSFQLLQEIEYNVRDRIIYSLPERRKMYGILANAYKWVGIDLSPYAEKIRDVIKMRLSELENISAIDIHEKRSLRDVLQRVYGDDRTFYLIHELVSLLKYLPSTLDLIVADSPLESVYYVFDLREGMIFKAEKVEDVNLIIKVGELISSLAPKKIKLYYRMKEHILKFLLGGPYLPSLNAMDRKEMTFVGMEMTLVNKSLNVVYNVRPLPVREALEKAIDHHLVYGKRNARIALKSLIDYGLKYGWNGIEVVFTPEKDSLSGFYLLHNHIAISGFEVREPNVEKLRTALEKLNDLILSADPVLHPTFRNKTVTVIKWAAAAPFSLIRRRHFGLPFRWLFMRGRRAHREFYHKLIFMMWGLDDKKHRWIWPLDNSPKRVIESHVLSTFPHVFIDIRGVLIKEGSIAESFIEKSVSGLPRDPGKRMILAHDVVSVAPIVISIQRRLLPNPELAENFIVTSFYEKGTISSPLLNDPSLMREIGNCVAWHAIQNPELLARETELHVGLALIAACYSMAGVKMPTVFRREPMITVNEKYIRRLIRYYLTRLIHVRYDRAIRGTKRELGEKLRELLEKGILRSRGIYQLDENRIIIRESFLDNYVLRGISLDDLAKFLNGSIEKLETGEEVVVVTIDNMVEALKRRPS